MQPSHSIQHISSHKEEIANSLTHGVGIVLSVFGFGALLTVAIIHGDVWSIVSAIVYGIALTMLYTSSTLYHAFRHPTIKRRLRVLDHCAIFVLIAGTYTPFLLVSLRATVWGSALFVTIWLCAAIGIVLKLFFTGRYELFSTLMYVAMGWLVVLAAKPMMESVPMTGLWWLVGGGVVYSIGAAFYRWERLPFHHSLWHVFVLLGSICHYIAICFYVLQ
jgi:hemolysin III